MRYPIAAVLAFLLYGYASATPVPDTISDGVGATAAQFRVDESGAATYTIPIYTPPGTAGVHPEVSLGYSSQGGNGPVGRGWAISGTSSIARCRMTRENGDFIVGGLPVNGDPPPVNFTSSDQFCLDGQRLIPAPAAALSCPILSGATVAQFRNEIDSQQRICAYIFTSADGPRFFTVERKDGSTSWYGDRVTTAGGATGPRTDGYVAGNGTGQSTKYLSWAQTRFMDSTGNYIDYLYAVNPAGSGYPGEQLLSQIQYTGKVVLASQSGTASTPYAAITFNYAALASTEFIRGFIAGTQVWQTQQLNGITVTSDGNTLRYYDLRYIYSVYAGHARMLGQLKECSDATQNVCMAPTVFTPSIGQTSFSTAETTTGTDFTGVIDYQLGDIDGDGVPDMVWIKPGTGSCTGSAVYVSFGQRDASGKQTFANVSQTPYCTPRTIADIGNAWHLIDYDGDGRQDLMIAGVAGTNWLILRSLGRPGAGSPVFDPNTNLIASLNPAIPVTSDNTDMPRLGDLNGDGQLDLVYSGSVRLSQRNPDGTWGWGSVKSLVVNWDPRGLGLCTGDTICSDGPSQYDSGAIHLYDFNGDGRSDLLREVVEDKNICAPKTPVRSSAVKRGARSPQPYAVQCTNTYRYIVAMTVDSITDTQVNLLPYHYWEEKFNYNALEITGFRLADINGDGLVDVLVRDASGNWIAQLNNGNGTFFGTQSLGTIPNDTKMQFVDVNSDGRADIVYPLTGSNLYAARLAQPDGTFAAESTLPGNLAQGCSTTNCVATFADVDGDGTIDFLRFGTTAADLYISRAPAASQFQPHDTLALVTNGYGATTALSYLSLNNAEVYRPDTGSRNGLNYARGSPIVDLLAPMYVVAVAQSSAPTYADDNAMSAVYYRYSGAKMQGGGRGFLGFRQITSIDSNFTGNYVATTTTYRQDWPFAGRPLTTAKRVLAGNYISGTCLTTISNGCFMPPGNPFAPFGGVLIAQSNQVWEASPAFASGTQQSMQVRSAGTVEDQFDLATGVRTGEIVTAFGYDTWANVTSTVVDTYNATDTTKLSTVQTTNAYNNYEASWRLGRLSNSTVTHTRGAQSTSRTASFTYTADAANTYLLNSERTQAGGSLDQDLRTLYDLDAYGNRTASYTCSIQVSDANCRSTTAVAFQAPMQWIHRTSRQSFDAIGRYPIASYGQFWNGTAGVEHATQTVLARNVFGEVSQAQDVNGVRALTVVGTLDRPYYAWGETVPGAPIGTAANGVESWTAYRWCGSGTNQVSCPAGAKFRQQGLAKGGPPKWTYLDVLGRPMLAVAGSFNVGITGTDFAASCTAYDALGKSERVSQPFLLSAAAVNGEPAFAAGSTPCKPITARFWNHSTFDVLGRTLQMFAADNSTTTSSYNGLSTTVTDALNHSTSAVKNALGELVSATDASGLTTQYAYDGAGNLTNVVRDGGRGPIVTTMSYDALGRKFSIIDPDAGNTSYDYNAVGEAVVEWRSSASWNASSNVVNEIDSRGRIYRKSNNLLPNSSNTLETQHLYTWDTGPNGIGLLASEASVGTYSGWIGQTGMSVSFSRGYGFDALGRVTNTQTNIDSIPYTTAAVFDAYGRPWKVQDASGKWLKSDFNSRGYVQMLCESTITDSIPTCTPGSANTYLQTQATDAWGHVLTEMRGGTGALVTNRVYDPAMGRLTEICAGGGACAIAKDDYVWDAVGNLTSRDKATLSKEEFSYDALNRVTSGVFDRIGTTNYSGAGRPVSLANTYDKLGNLCSKLINNVQTGYGYAGRAGCGIDGSAGNGGGWGSGSTNAATSPHQVTGIGASTYSYDVLGNQILAHSDGINDRGIAYSGDAHAYEILKGAPAAPSARTRFWYGSDGARYKRVELNGQRTLYVGGLEIVTAGGVSTYKRYIGGVAMQDVVNGTPTTKYLFGDQIGSVETVTDVAGTVLERMDYAPFGERRNATTPTLLLTSYTPTSTTHGFTGQEEVDGLDVIHFNGRLFDAVIGKFLQADPIVQDPGNPQNFNRYTYVFNNPLANTDPTGMFSWRQFGAIVIGVVAIITQQYWALKGAAALWLYVGAGFVSGYISSGTLKGGLIGAFGAGLTFGVAAGFAGANPFVQILAQGSSGGIIESLQGGNFGHGFLVAGLGAAVMPQISRVGNPVGKVVVSALAGGTISELTGGKFVNGAESWAMQAATQEAVAAAGRSSDNGDSGPNSAGAAYSGNTANGVSGTAGSFGYQMWAGVDSSGSYGSGILLTYNGTYNGDATNLNWLQTYQAYSPAAGEDGTWQFDNRYDKKTNFYPAQWARGREFQDFPASSTTRWFQAETSIVSRNPGGTYSIIGTVKWGYAYTAGAGLNGVSYGTPVVTTPSPLQQGYIKSLNGGH